MPAPALKAEPAPTKMRESLDAEKMFADFQRDGFRLRAPALQSELFRYQHLTAAGLCLDPIIRPGDELYIDGNNAAAFERSRRSGCARRPFRVCGSASAGRNGCAQQRLNYGQGKSRD
jgi:hypothetical protein